MLRRLKKHVLALLIVCGGLGLVPAYLHAFTIVGASEIPTVLLGDKLLVNNAAYALTLPYSNRILFRTGSPRRGDFVFLRLANDPHAKGVFFKRIIGLSGETIELRETEFSSTDGRYQPEGSMWRLFHGCRRRIPSGRWLKARTATGSRLLLKEANIEIIPPRGSQRANTS
jgi:signal peptidase I